MLRHRGFVELTLVAWGVAAALFASLCLAAWVQTQRLELAEARIQTYEAAGKAHEATVEALNKRNREQKRHADTRIADAGAVVDLGADRLLGDIASRGVVADRGVAGDSGLACFDGAELDRALSDFAREDAERSREGQKAVGALDELRAWRKGK